MSTDLGAFIQEMHEAHVAAHGPDCGVKQSGLAYDNPCMVVRRAWVAAFPEKVRAEYREKQRVREWNSRDHRWKGPRTCPRCNVGFTPTKPNQAYCSSQCGWLHRTAIEPKNSDWAAGHQPERPIDCLRCGVSFVARASFGYCLECKPIARREVEARKQQRLRERLAGDPLYREAWERKFRIRQERRRSNRLQMRVASA